MKLDSSKFADIERDSEYFGHLCMALQPFLGIKEEIKSRNDYVVALSVNSKNV